MSINDNASTRSSHILTGLTLPGLTAEICCHRDAFGIPHVRASSLADAFFGQGFFTAEDRLFQMDLDRRRAYGRTSELLGPTGLPTDRYLRKFQINAHVRRDYQHLGAATQAMLCSYAAGVNAYLQAAAALPIEYSLLQAAPEHWQPWDCLAVFAVRHLFMGVFEGKLWRARLVSHFGASRAAEMMPTTPNDHLCILPPGSLWMQSGLEEHSDLGTLEASLAWLEEVEVGSNNWVVSGSRTQSGSPLLAGDPHRALDTPNVYYQNHLTCPEFDVIGFSFPGLPGFPHFAHNAETAWAITHANTDYQDLYIEQFQDGQAPRYLFRGRWLEAEETQETILVKGGEPEPITLLKTIHGPVLHYDEQAGYGLAIKYTAFDRPNRTFDCLLPMMMARNADDLVEAVRQWVDPGNNMVYADTHGNIGYLTRGMVPIRPGLENFWVPVPGWTGEHEWKGLIPFENLPRSRNPKNGYVVTANNRITAAGYPHTLGLFFAPDFRARRISGRLLQLSKATAADMESVHAERQSIPAEVLLGLLDNCNLPDPAQAALLLRLRQWAAQTSACMDPDRIEPTVYSAFRQALNQLVLTPLLGDLASSAFRSPKAAVQRHLLQLSSQVILDIQAADTRMLPPRSEWRDVVQQAFLLGIEQLQAVLGTDEAAWRWGTVHFVSPAHPLSALFPEEAARLNPPRISAGGDGDTPQAARFRLGIPFVISGTSVARYIFDLSDWDQSRWIVPLGSSGQPESQHYADQSGLWSAVRSVQMTYSWDQVEKQAVSTQRLVPHNQAP